MSGPTCAKAGSSTAATRCQHEAGTLYDASVQVGVDDFYRGVVEVHNEFGTNKRQGVLTLYDQDGTPWFLWVSTAGQLWINSSDPETYDEGTPGSELVGEQHS